MKQGKKENSIHYLKHYLVIVFFLIVISLFVKAVVMITSSSFKADAYNLLLLNNDAHIVHIDLKNNKMTVSTIGGYGKILSDKKRLYDSIYLRVPIDGVVDFTNKKDQQINREYFSIWNLFSLLSNVGLRRDNINEVDLVKFFFYSSSMRNSDVDIKRIDLFNGKIVDEPYEDSNKEFSVLNDKTSIEVINSSGVNGLGAKVSYMLKNAGFNVVSVTSTDNETSSKIISGVGDKNISLKRLSEIFKFSKEIRKESSIADITIIFGKENNIVL